MSLASLVPCAGCRAAPEAAPKGNAPVVEPPPPGVRAAPALAHPPAVARCAGEDAALVAASDGSDFKRVPCDDAAVCLGGACVALETWIHHLRGKQVDESTRYEKLNKVRDCKDAVGALAALCDNGQPPSLPSLRAACAEFNRL